jgi:hypothetical protein
MGKKYKHEDEYKKSYTKTIAIVVSEDLLSQINHISKDVLKDQYSRSFVVREILKKGIEVFLEKIEEEEKK